MALQVTKSSNKRIHLFGLLFFLLILLFISPFGILIASDDEDDDDDDDEDDEDEVSLQVIQFEDPRKVLTNYPNFKVKIDKLPDFKVKERLRDKEYWKCGGCHDGKRLKSKPKYRELVKEHEDINLNHLRMKHGEEEYWCTTCHDTARPDYLVDIKKQPIHFNQSFLLCGQCHSGVQKDWFFGAHGKRVGTWDGERVILLCTECHNPHSPNIKGKLPQSPPSARKGHLIEEDHVKHSKMWEKNRDLIHDISKSE